MLILGPTHKKKNIKFLKFLGDFYPQAQGLLLIDYLLLIFRDITLHEITNRITYGSPCNI
jgi:hypothetical protein